MIARLTTPNIEMKEKKGKTKRTTIKMSIKKSCLNIYDDFESWVSYYMVFVWIVQTICGLDTNNYMLRYVIINQYWYAWHSKRKDRKTTSTSLLTARRQNFVFDQKFDLNHFESAHFSVLKKKILHFKNTFTFLWWNVIKTKILKYSPRVKFLFRGYRKKNTKI